MNLKKTILFLIGCISVTLGTIGIFLPVLPTTPFVLLAAGCFSMSNKKFEERLKQNKYFGSYITNYQDKSGIPLKIKIRAIFFLWISLIISGILIQKPVIIGILAIIGTGVTIHLLLIKTKKEST
ncbi:hypothetical protein EDD66_102258 [Mobilisporobacter senegalensis]|uniref:DUF454 domain-containing protein n=1 Tax=Mobilisporobacter senegalensis TaxID=1329262 RepID=A0A3N1XVF5_9FIRM|nr:YbaN family protein [Mobilisporobacter senegalensis]ROR30605.1 hypothetical protein EDD66_102258 [Mobilisporobacter senegalensis]